MLKLRLAGFAVALVCSCVQAQIGRPPEKPKAPEAQTLSEVKPRAGEVRATWLRLGEGEALSTPAKTAETMKKLRDLGLNTVYVSVWQEGNTMFPSAAMEKVAGTSVKSLEISGRDLLSESLIEAHRNGLLYIAYFEGGLSATRRDKEAPLRRKDAWILKDAKGAAMGPLSCSWLNPAVPEVRAAIVDMIIEAVDRYDLDGVQIDERMCWPDFTLGYDQTTKDLYTKETGKPVPDDAKEPAWVAWRAGKGKQLIQEIAGAVKNKRPGLIMSLGVPTPALTMEQWKFDWPALFRGGYFDEVLAKCFRPGAADFKTAWDEVAKAVGTRRPEVVVGLRAIGGDGPDLPWSELKTEIEGVRELKGAGYAISSNRSLLYTHGTAFNEFFAVAKNGRVRHPLRGLEWRAGAQTPEKMNSRGQFLVVKGLPGGIYRVIAGGKEPGMWVESSLRLAESAAKLTPEQATMMTGGGTIEFLIDRRADNELAIPDPNAPPPPKLEPRKKGEKPGEKAEPGKPGEAPKPEPAKPDPPKPGQPASPGKPGGG